MCIVLPSVYIVLPYKPLGNVAMKEGRKEILFNNALNTFYLWLYGIGNMVKDHSDSQKGNVLLPLQSSKVFL